MFTRTSFLAITHIAVSLIVLLCLACTAQAEIIAQWDFASSGNLLADSSGNGNTLAISGATAWSSDTPSGSGLSGSAEFDGTTSTMETVAAMDYSGYTSLKFSWWQKFTGSSAGVVFQTGEDIGTLLGSFSSVCNNNNKAGQGQITFHTAEGFNYDIDRYVNLFGTANDTWEYIETEIDLEAAAPADTVKIWKDGTEVVSNILTATPPDSFVTGEKLYIGYRPTEDNTWSFCGKIAGLTVEGTPVPEPTCIALLAGVLAWLLLHARHRQ